MGYYCSSLAHEEAGTHEPVNLEKPNWERGSAKRKPPQLRGGVGSIVLPWPTRTAVGRAANRRSHRRPHGWAHWREQNRRPYNRRKNVGKAPAGRAWRAHHRRGRRRGKRPRLGQSDAQGKNLRRYTVRHSAVVPDIYDVAGPELAGNLCIYNDILSCFKVNNKEMVPLHLNHDGLHEHAWHLRSYYKICRLQSNRNSSIKIYRSVCTR